MQRYRRKLAWVGRHRFWLHGVRGQWVATPYSRNWVVAAGQTEAELRKTLRLMKTAGVFNE